MTSLAPSTSLTALKKILIVSVAIVALGLSGTMSVAYANGGGSGSSDGGDDGDDDDDDDDGHDGGDHSGCNHSSPAPTLQLYVPPMPGDNAFNNSSYQASSPTDPKTWVREGQSGVPWELWAVASGSQLNADGSEDDHDDDDDDDDDGSDGVITSWQDVRLVASWLGAAENALSITLLSVNGVANGAVLNLGACTNGGGVRCGGGYFGQTTGYIAVPGSLDDPGLEDYSNGENIFANGSHGVHAPFATNTAWAEIDLGAFGPAGLGEICNYTAGTSNCSGDETGWMAKLGLITNGLPAGVQVHFDLWGIANVSFADYDEVEFSEGTNPPMPGAPYFDCELEKRYTSYGTKKHWECKILNVTTEREFEVVHYDTDARWEQVASTTTDVPVPGALSLLGFGLLGLGMVVRRRRANVQ